MAEIKWSNSALTTLQQCGERFRRRYIEREITRPSPRMLRGTIVHKSATVAYMRKLQQQSLPTVEETKDLAATAFDTEWLSGVALTEEETALGVKAVRDESKDFAVDLAGFHVQAVAPAVNPVGVERHITVKPKDSDLTIHGTIDLIDSTPAGEIIRDLKTSVKSPNGNAAEESQQLSLYAMIRMAEVGRLPAKLRLDYLVRTPKKAEKKYVPLDTTRDAQDVQSVVNRINTAVEAVQRGIFVPANPDAWFCSKDYCDYFTSCPYVRRGDRRPTT